MNFDWPDARAAWLKVEEEIREAAEALASGDAQRIGEELGDALFSLVNVARLSGLDADDALHGTIEKFRRRFTDMETDLAARGKSVSGVAPDELERAWEASESWRARRETVMRLRIGQSSISIERGDITDWEVDAIINAANSTLSMGTGVAGTIKRKGGVIIEEEAMRQGPVEIGEAVLTTGGNLAATHVIHAAVMGPDLKADGEQIAATTRAVLALAAKHRITSLALPALGTGVGHVPPAVSANAMLNAVVSHLKGSPTGLKRVVFVLYQDDAYKAFTDTLKRLGGVQ